MIPGIVAAQKIFSDQDTFTEAGEWEAVGVGVTSDGLVATNTGTSPFTQGVWGIPAQTTGKYYFEVEFTNVLPVPPADPMWGLSVGFGLVSIGIDETVDDVRQSVIVRAYQGYIENNNGSTGFNLTEEDPATFNPAHLANGDWVGCAVDVDARLVWFRLLPGGLWNGRADSSPATGENGIALAPSAEAESKAYSASPFAGFGMDDGVGGAVITANFGLSAFLGTVPTGFTGRWPPPYRGPAVGTASGVGAAQASNLSPWTQVYLASMSSTNPGWAGNTMRLVIPASAISTSGVQVRLTIKGGLANCAALYIGHGMTLGGNVYDFESTPVPVTVGGSTSFDVFFSPEKTSDVITFNLDESKPLLFSAYFSGSSSQLGFNSAGSGTSYKRTGNDAAVMDGTGYGSGTTGAMFIRRIEVRYPVGANFGTSVGTGMASAVSL